jgi:hypothetical protein
MVAPVLVGVVSLVREAFPQCGGRLVAEAAELARKKAVSGRPLAVLAAEAGEW